MDASASVTISSTNASFGHAFWERLWRTAGIQSAGLFVLSSILYGYQPQLGASANALAAFYGGGRARVLIASVLAGIGVLNLMWFASAIRAKLADAGQDGWGGAATAASATVGGLFFLLITMTAALAYSIAGSGNPTLTTGLNDLSWTGFVLTSFPRAMLIMAGTFGFWRARLISNTLFAVGVTAVVLVLLGGTTWASNGFWAPDGAYSRFISPFIGLAWIVAASGVLLTRGPASRAGW